jgi:hypothetical protein
VKCNVHPNVTTLTYNEYKSMDSDALLETIRRSHIVLTDCPIVSRDFDESGLVRLGALKKKITVYGLFIMILQNSKIGANFYLSKIIQYRKLCLTRGTSQAHYCKYSGRRHTLTQRPSMP